MYNKYDECPNQTITGCVERILFRSVRIKGNLTGGEALGFFLKKFFVIFQYDASSAIIGVGEIFSKPLLL
jgi:hypothetical protein